MIMSAIVAPPVGPEMQAYLRRFITRKPSLDIAVVLDRYIVQVLKDEGLYDSSFIWPFFGSGDRDGTVRELRTGAFTFVDEVPANPYALGPYVGAQGDGVGSMTLNVTPSAMGYGIDKHWALLLILSDNPSLAYEWGAQGGSFLDYQAKSGAVAKIGPGSTARITNAVSTAIGVQGYVREDIHGGYEFQNGIYVDWITGDSILPTGKIKLGRSGETAPRSLNVIGLLIQGINVVPSKDACTRITNSIWAMADLLGIVPEQPPPVDLGPNWFGQVVGSSMVPPKTVFRLTRKPLVGETKDTFAAFPVDFAVTTFTTVVGDPAVGAFSGIWSNRPLEVTPGVPLPRLKPNAPTGGNINVRATLFGRTVTLSAGYLYTNDVKAMAADYVGVSYACGHDARSSADDPDGKGFLDHADDGGFDTSPWAALTHDQIYTDQALDTGDVHHRAFAVANASAIFTELPPGASNRICCTDRIILSRYRAPDDPCAYGIWLDFEKHVSVDPATAVAHLRKLAGIAHGKGLKFAVFSNPLDGSTGASNGFDKSLSYQILQPGGVDFLSLSIAGQGAAKVPVLDQLAAQYDVLTGPLGDQVPDPDKLVILLITGIQFNEMTAAEAAACRDWAEARGIKAVYPFPQYAVTGGPPTNAMNRNLGTYCRLALS